MTKQTASSKRPVTRASTGKRASVRKASSTRATAKRTSGAARKRAVVQKAAKRKTATRAAASRSRAKAAPRSSRLSAAATLIRGVAAGAVVAVAERLPWSKNGNDPIVLLEADHRRFEDLLKQGEETTARAVKRRTELLDALTAALNVHELIEEKVLYPALASHPTSREIVLEGTQEHHVADLIIKELHTLARNDQKWGPKFKVLKESIEHHIKEEEHKMFPVARAVLSRAALDALGAQMKAQQADARRVK